MNTTHSINSEATVIKEMLKGSSTVFSRLGKTHETKVKLILEDETMSTREKLEALDENDYQMIMKWLGFGVCVVSVAVMISTGRPINLEGVRKIGQAIAA